MARPCRRRWRWPTGLQPIRRWPWRWRKMRHWPALRLRSRKAWSMRSVISSSLCVRPTTWKGKRHSWASAPPTSRANNACLSVIHRGKTMQLNSDISAIITGGASGLGAATTRRLASRGVKVAIFDMNETVGQALASELGGVYCNVDVTSEEQVDTAFAKARAAIGQERILVNCAGTADAVKTVSRDKKTGEIRPCAADRFNRIIQINLVGTFRCIAKSAAGMLTLAPLTDGERGVIVNTASAAAQDGQVGQASYAASKAAIVGMTLPIARDMMDEGIRINTIMPGIFGTPLLLGLPDNVKQALAASVPFPKRLGDPDEFAQAVEFLVTCGYMNAESIRVDGAIRMAPR
mmetsp:Transcript_5966/g.23681  ORF Transcript_5966/g.23681 Transcript_5966/m.23681 type:complete len:349 (+) Transcript_5966:359-1405(+)